MNKLLLWLVFSLSAVAFVSGVVSFVDGNPLGYALAPLSLALLFWAALRLRRVNLRGAAPPSHSCRRTTPRSPRSSTRSRPR